IISQSSIGEFQLASPIQNVLTLGTDVTPNSIYWFRPYLSSEFPEITCDKTYLFLYSTDHDSGGGGGGIYWGKGNNLDCSDFEELGLIIEGYQAETPF